MDRYDEEMAVRDARSDEIIRAFQRAQLGVVHQRSPGMPYSSVIAYINYGFGGQRQVIVTVEDSGDCQVFLTKLYEVPVGETGRGIDVGQVPLLIAFSGTTPNLGETIVRRVRQASMESSETIPTKLFDAPQPPIPIRELKTLGDLIDAYEAHYLCEPYSDLLRNVLGKMGKVSHKGEEWFVEYAGHICHSETAPGSKPVLHPDGEPVVYTNAVNVRLAPFLGDLDSEP